MTMKLRQTGFLFLIIFTIVLDSCTLATYGDSSHKKFRRDIVGHYEIATNDNFTEDTDVLFMMYLDGDNNLNNVSWKNLMDAQTGLMNLDENTKVTVIALIDGNKKKVEEEGIESPIGSEQTFLFKLGAFTTTEYTQEYFTAASSIDYSNCVDWIYNTYYEVDMSSGDTLYNFLNWAKKHFNANTTILAVQNHGGGPYNEVTTSISSRSICTDDTNHPDDNFYLSTTDVATAINKTFGKIDMLVEDVCLQCSIEEIYGLQDAVHYLIASPNKTYVNTYNYDKIIPEISKGANIEEIGKKFIDYNYDICKNRTLRSKTTSNTNPTCMELSLTLVDCSKKDVLENIKNHTSELAEALLADEEQTRTYIGELPYISGKFYGLSFEASYAYTQDLGIMAFMLANYSKTTAPDNVKNAATTLLNDLKNNSLIVYAWAGGAEHNWYYSGDTNYGEDEDFRISTDGKCPWGISITCGRIYKTTTSGKILTTPNLKNYKNWSEFARNNKWADLLAKYKN